MLYKQDMPSLSVVMPSMNEEETIRICIQKAQTIFKNYGIEGEIIVADNSSDRTAEIAASMGAKVIGPIKGYGNAYLKGLAEAKGDYIAIADADNTYDLLELDKFLDPLMAGEADFIMGTRLKGEIKKGAMPWLHQYIGNPILTAMLNFLFKTKISDAHCGMRAFTKESLEKMNLKTHGMELASEMIIEAARCGLRIKEVPITYYSRKAPSKLRSFQDGWRHVRFMMLYRPGPFLYIPGAFVFVLGFLITASLLLTENAAYNRLHSFILGSMLLIIGGQILATGGYMKTYGLIHGMYRDEKAGKKLLSYHSLERELLGGSLILALGLVIGLKVAYTWVISGYGSLKEVESAVISMVLAAVGLQLIFSAVFVSVMLLEVDTDW
ncbi:TPA: glycosyltransferase family 2 protein [Methanosarcina acetivorans]|uniref:Dolichyl-phosphate beta-D-mannosyltransferase n=3 Tax=Methanosarcina acetivorans TaxID=2214 RepID=Q8TRI8_METAC|nr:glycosyltransferase family 2 protein [Methanosarcina acetivorans]AAM04608.1 dolichyl-phosphate beta-D-mannosyltransferase [Methanosarcina acetivorans C2A]HIH94921.1 glycosyltransferase family 2 protein [Methanosarcina acetivorans]